MKTEEECVQCIYMHGKLLCAYNVCELIWSVQSCMCVCVCAHMQLNSNDLDVYGFDSLDICLNQNQSFLVFCRLLFPHVSVFFFCLLFCFDKHSIIILNESKDIAIIEAFILSFCCPIRSFWWRRNQEQE